MKIDKKVARGFTWGDVEDGFVVVEDKIVNHSRWSVGHTLVVEKEGKYYSAYYQVGATESQDESPFEYDGEQIDFKEVQKIERMATFYE